MYGREAYIVLNEINDSLEGDIQAGQETDTIIYQQQKRKALRIKKLWWFWWTRTDRAMQENANLFTLTDKVVVIDHLDEQKTALKTRRFLI